MGTKPSKGKKEAAIQKAVVRWCRERPLFSLVFEINNDGKKSIGKAMQDKRMGTLPGMTDLGLPLPEGRVVWLEVKTKEGRLSKEQKATHGELNDFAHEVYTVYGYDDAIETLERIDSQHEFLGRVEG